MVDGTPVAAQHRGRRGPRSPRTPSLRAGSPRVDQLLSIIPLSLSTTVVCAIFLAPLTTPTAAIIAAILLAFFAYWFVRSSAVALSVLIGERRLRRWEQIDWYARYRSYQWSHPTLEPWEWPRHVVIIPNFQEPDEILNRTLCSLAAQANAEQLVVVLAMEARELDASAKAHALIAGYLGIFRDIFATFHPPDLPGEASGKGSNEAWAARQSFVRLIIGREEDLDRYTVTSCDADAVFHPRHFEALNYLFLTAAGRHRTFWQPAIFNSNNIWEVPAPLRIIEGLSGINRLANLVLPMSVKMPTSCYSLSWRLLHTVDYWDEEVIPEDWHLYLKCAFSLGDDVRVEGLFLPLGNNSVVADGWLRTMREHYGQALRHAWGASDIPYAWRAVAAPGGSIGRIRALVLASNLTKVHVLWAAQWFIVTLGVVVPMRLAVDFGAPVPGWWTARVVTAPGATWHLEHLDEPSRWLALGPDGLIGYGISLNLAGAMIALCVFPLLVLIAAEWRLRGGRPGHVSRLNAAASIAAWPLLAPVTFLFAAAPAFHAQWRLASGRGLRYRVAQKAAHRRH